MSQIPEAFADPGVFADVAEPFAIGLIIFLLIFYLVILVFGIVSYVFSSIGMYTIAKRRGIHHPWLAWIPVANTWILGSISDQYQFVAKGKVRSRRKLLLILNIIMAVLPGVMSAFATITTAMTMGMDETAIIGALFGVLGVWLVILVLAIVNAIFTYIALYDLYNSCNPYNAVAFLLLSIFISVTQPFFVFACRKKDLGMPPRKQPQEPVQEIPQEIPAAETEAPAEPAADEPIEETIQVPDADCTADDGDFEDTPEVTE